MTVTTPGDTLIWGGRAYHLNAGRVPAPPPGGTIPHAVDAVIRAELSARMPAARRELLARYRAERALGLSPYAALQHVRGSAAGAWLRPVWAGLPASPADLAVALAADQAIHSREDMPVHWWRP